MTHSLLALDLALHTGYAGWATGEMKPMAGLLTIDPKKEIGERLASLYKWTLRVTKERAVTDICVEAPLTTAGSAQKIFWLVSAYGVVCMAGAQCNINVVPIANATMFIHWAGSNTIEGAQRKSQSVVEAQRRGFPLITDHNIADALGLLSLRCAVLGLSPPWDYRKSPGPLFSGAHVPAGLRITRANKRAAAIIVNKATSFNAGEG